MTTQKDTLLAIDFFGKVLTFLKADKVVKNMFPKVDYFQNTQFGALCLIATKLTLEDVEEKQKHRYFQGFDNIMYEYFYTNDYEDLKRFKKKQRDLFDLLEEGGQGE